MKATLLLPPLAARIAMLLPLVAISRGDTLKWDADGAFPPPPEDPVFGTVVDGDGNWNGQEANWTADNGTTNVPWTNPAAGWHDAVIGKGDRGGSIILGAIETNDGMGNITSQQLKVRNLTFPLLSEGAEYILGGGTDLRLMPRATRSVIDVANPTTNIGVELEGGGFIKRGTGTLTLSRSNGNQWEEQLSDIDIEAGSVVLNGGNGKHMIMRGRIAISSGATLQLSKPNNLINDDTLVQLADGATFDLYSQAEIFGYLSGSGTFKVSNGFDPDSVWGLQLGGGGAHHIFSGVVPGTGTITLNAPNTKSRSVQEFTGVNTFTGKLVIQAGTLAFSRLEALGNEAAMPDKIIDLGHSSTTEAANYGILRYTGTADLTMTRPLNLAGSAGGGGIEADGTGALTWNGAITVLPGAKPFVLGGNGTGQNVLGVPLPNAPDGTQISLLKTGESTWKLTQPNTFTGPVEIGGGILDLVHADALPTAAGQQNSVRIDAGSLLLNGVSRTFGNGVDGTGLTGAGGVVRNNVATPVTVAVAVNQSAAAPQVFRGQLSDAGGGTMSVIKRGPGNWTISGTQQAYSGPTTVEAGVLRVEVPVGTTPPVAAPSLNLDASDASTLTVSAGVVTEWRDKSGAGHIFTKPLLTSPSAPAYVTAAQNGLNAVSFDGVKDVLSASPAALGFEALTVFIVAAAPDNGTDGGILGGDGISGTVAERGIRGLKPGYWYDTGSNADFTGTGSSGQFRVNGARTGRIPSAGGGWHILSAVRSGTALRYNSVGGFTRPNETSVIKQFWFKGQIGQVLVYPATLSQADILKTEAWLKAKWFGGVATGNILPPATDLTVNAGGFDCAAPQTLASLNLGAPLLIGSPVGELNVTGTATLRGGAQYFYNITDWTPSPGIGQDVLTAHTIDVQATAASKMTVRILGAGLTNGTRTPRSFILARATSALTGFDPANVTLNTTNFTQVPGTWAVVQNGLNIELQFTPAAPTPFEAWTESFGLSAAQAAAGADPDGDGFTNAMEFLVNGNPVSNAVNVPLTFGRAVAGADEVFTLTIPFRTGATFAGAAALSASAEGATCIIEGSEDLAAWTMDMDEITPAITAGLPALPSGWEYHTFRTPGALSGDPSDFVRVRFTAP